MKKFEHMLKVDDTFSTVPIDDAGLLLVKDIIINRN